MAELRAILSFDLCRPNAVCGLELTLVPSAAKVSKEPYLLLFCNAAKVYYFSTTPKSGKT